MFTSNPLSDLKRRASRRQRKPEISGPIIQPTLDTSSGIIAIRYTDSPEHSATSTPISEKSENSFDGYSDQSSSPPSPPGPPGPPKRSASRRTVPKSVMFFGIQATATPSTEGGNAVAVAVADVPPPIPPKSPYRASRLMVQLQHELAETPEAELEVEERSFYVDDDDDHSDRCSMHTV